MGEGGGSESFGCRLTGALAMHVSSADHTSSAIQYAVRVVMLQLTGASSMAHKKDDDICR